MTRRVYIDNCIGCGLCVEMFPEAFSMEEEFEKAHFNEGQNDSPAVAEAAALCPVGGIIIEE